MDPGALIRRIAARLGLGLVTALVVVAATFLLMELTPGGLESRVNDPQLPGAVKEGAPARSR